MAIHGSSGANQGSGTHHNPTSLTQTIRTSRYVTHETNPHQPPSVQKKQERVIIYGKAHTNNAAKTLINPPNLPKSDQKAKILPAGSGTSPFQNPATGGKEGSNQPQNGSRNSARAAYSLGSTLKDFGANFSEIQKTGKKDQKETPLKLKTPINAPIDPAKGSRTTPAVFESIRVLETNPHQTKVIEDLRAKLEQANRKVFQLNAENKKLKYYGGVIEPKNETIEYLLLKLSKMNERIGDLADENDKLLATNQLLKRSNEALMSEMEGYLGQATKRTKTTNFEIRNLNEAVSGPNGMFNRTSVATGSFVNEFSHVFKQNSQTVASSRPGGLSQIQVLRDNDLEQRGHAEVPYHALTERGGQNRGQAQKINEELLKEIKMLRAKLRDSERKERERGELYSSSNAKESSVTTNPAKKQKKEKKKKKKKRRKERRKKDTETLSRSTEHPSQLLSTSPRLHKPIEAEETISMEGRFKLSSRLAEEDRNMYNMLLMENNILRRQIEQQKERESGEGVEGQEGVMEELKGTRRLLENLQKKYKKMKKEIKRREGAGSDLEEDGFGRKKRKKGMKKRGRRVVEGSSQPALVLDSAVDEQFKSTFDSR